jgi:surface polysaccharide O-acyltransferase-like enzyme
MIIYYFVKNEVIFPITLSNSTDLQSFFAFFANLATGRTLIAYWYIPFIMLMFLVSPLILKFIDVEFSNKILITVVLFLLSSFFQRPSLGLNPFHSLVYFLPFYLFGIIYAERAELLNTWLKNNVLLTFCSWILVLVVMTFFGQSGNINKDIPWHYFGFDWMVIQKITLIFTMLSFLQRFLQSRNEFLEFIANISFALFFIHPLVLSFVSLIGFNQQLSGFLGFVILAIFVVSSSIILTFYAEKALGEKSKFIIGY